MNDECEQDMARLRAAIEVLGEHFDAVQIFATRYDPPDGTVNVHDGTGNWFARFGQVSDWLTKNTERTRQEARTEGD